MKIVADRAVPFLEGVFDRFGEVVFADGLEISKDMLLDADCLIIRNRTKCGPALLEGTGIKMIATATIGTDHIDLDYCKEKGIFVQNASGCNAGGTMNYVFSALYGIAARKSMNLDGMTFGIVGLGNTGSRVDNVARSLGFKVLRCDPPRAEAEGETLFCSLDFLLENSDIVSLHVPLNDSTRGLAGTEFFEKIKPGAIFINTSRGEVVDETALTEAVPKLGSVVLDTWCNEPDVNLRLMNMVDIATPHIAGYSYQGKLNATAMTVRSVARYFQIESLYDFFPQADVPELSSVRLDLHGKSQGEVASMIQYNYPVFTDDFMFRMNPGGFEELRTNYKYRKEFFI